MTQPRMIGDRYELGELIGYGGMAEVHRGRDTRLNREVAIKVLRADLARDPAFLNRFRREAHAAAGLNHPAIVSVYDTGEGTAADGTSQPFIVMEFVAGRTLRDIVKSEGSLPPRRAMEITAEIDDALEFSHRNGIIHRDIKPANVMITPQGAVKVMDFGIARAVADSSATVTQTANVIGTAQYLSPEQARGETVDARSDVYSTGCLLYELVTGAPPFQGDSPVAVAYQHVRENPVMPSARKPGIPRVLDSIVMKALAKNPLNRYQSAAEMSTDLRRALANQPVTAEAVMTDAERTQFIARTPPPPVAPRRDEYEPPAEDNDRRMALVWAAVVVALLLVIGVATFLILDNRGGGTSNENTNDVSVPSLAGMTETQAQTALQNLGLIYARSANPVSSNSGCLTPVSTSSSAASSSAGAGSNLVQPGQVCTTSPTPGQKVAKNTTVTVTYYELAQLKDNLVGMQFDAAQKILQQQNIPYTNPPTYVNILDANQKAVAGEVVAQSPAQYSNLQPGQKISLQVATGLLQLPSEVGKSQGDAANAIQNIGFNNLQAAQMVPTNNPAQNGLVQQVQVVDPGVQNQRAQYNQTDPTLYRQDAKITLVVYQYVAPTPSCDSNAPAPGSSASGSASASASASSSSTLPPCTTG